MNFDIVPRIDIQDVSGEEEVVVTSSREVSSILWKITESMKEYSVFQKERRFPTQLVFRNNPGYADIDVFHLIIPATYIARVWNFSIVEFLKTDLEEHFKNLNSIIVIGGGINERYPQQQIVSFDQFKEVALTWIFKEMYTLVRNTIDYPDVLDNSNTGEGELQTAQTTLTKLHFLKPGDSFVDDKVIVSWIKKLEGTYIPTLRLRHLHLSTLKMSVDQASKELEFKIDTFHDDQNKVKRGEMGFPDLVSELLKLLAEITQYNGKISVIASEFEKGPCSRVMQEIALMTPPEK